MEKAEIRIQYVWEPLREADGTTFLYPSLIRKENDRPGVYRWTFCSCDRDTLGPHEVLIGETESLLRRLREYVKPTTPTERSWRDFFHSSIAAGWKIECHILSYEPFKINGVSLNAESIHNPFARKLIESWMILVHPREGCTVLNKGRNLKVKRAEAALRKAKDLQAKADQLRSAIRRTPN